MTATTVQPSPDVTSDAGWSALLDRLNDLSVTKHFDAYADIDWDSPELALDPEDPRWELLDDPLTQTDWYRALPATTKARLGCEVTASKMRLGLEFESVLKRGLLEYAAGLPSGAPEFRYVYHEVIEEAQHALMFQEFVNRSGFRPAGLSPATKVQARFVIGMARWFPELFFVFVLGGEDPIDHVQRRALRHGNELHPLKQRIMTIHVTEEARHLSFARRYLQRSVPRLSGARRAALAVGAPVVLAAMAEMMLKPSPQVIRRYEIPPDVVREAYTNNPAHRAAVVESLRKLRALCDELGLTKRPYDGLWRRLGLTTA